jgi:hypothetical protein
MLKRNLAAFAAMLLISTFFLTAAMAESRHSRNKISKQFVRCLTIKPRLGIAATFRRS